MSKEQMIKKVSKKMDELERVETTEDLIKQGIYEFSLGDSKYRVRKPTHQERIDIQKKRREVYTKLVQDDSYLFEDEWKKIHKKKGKDIDAMDSEVISLQKQKDALDIRLDKATRKKDIDLLEDEIDTIVDKQSKIMDTKNDLLQYSIESTVNAEADTYTLYLLLELFEENEWKKAFETYEDFLMGRNEDLIIRGTYYLTLLMWNPNV